MSVSEAGVFGVGGAGGGGGAVRLLAGILEAEPLKCKWKYTYTEVLMLRVRQVTYEIKI